jgi:hypothetical protein
MATYFVDYENVGSAGIEGIDTLPEGNTVHIFYSVKADTMKMDQVIQLMRVSANVEFHDVTMRGQKNALDFQLIAMLYFTKKEDDTCYIISKDQGYDAAIVFGRKIGAEQVYRRVSICSENIGDVKPQQQTRRSGRRGGDSRQNAYNNNQEQPVLLAERAQGVTTLPYQREVIRPPRHGRKEEPAKQDTAKAAEPVRQDAVKAAEPAFKDSVRREKNKHRRMRADGNKLDSAYQHRIAARCGGNARALCQIRKHLACLGNELFGVADSAGNSGLDKASVELINLAVFHKVVNVISVTALGWDSAC